MITWSKIFHIQQIEENCLINGDGTVIIGYDVILPQVYTLTIREINDVNDQLIKAIKFLPEGTTVHKMDFFFEGERNEKYYGENIITKHNNHHYNQKSLLRHYCKLYIYFNSVEIKPGYNNNTYLKPKDFLFKKPFKKVEKSIRTIKKNIISFENSVNSIDNMKFYRMDNNKLGQSLYEYLSCDFDSQAKGDYKDLILPPAENREYVKVGNKYVSVVSLVKETSINRVSVKSKCQHPGSFDNNIDFENNIDYETSFLYPVGLGLPINHILNTSITILGKESTINRLNTEERELSFPAAMGIKGAKYKKEEIDDFVEEIERYDRVPVYVKVNAVITDTSLDRLQKYSLLCVDSFRNLGCNAIIENYDNFNLFFTSAPGNIHRNYRLFMTTVERAVSYFTKETAYLSHKSGLVYCDRPMGNPFVLEMWNNPELDNRNKIIIGPSGTGKSFYINDYLTQCLAQGNHIVMIDIGHSYKRNCEYNNGLYYDSGKKDLFKFNLFLCRKDTEGNYMYSESEKDETYTQLNIVVDGLKVLWRDAGGFKNSEIAILQEIVEDYYKKVNKEKSHPDLEGFYKFLEYYKKNHLDNEQASLIDINDLKYSLKPFAVGEFKSLLNAKEEINIINDRLILFDLEEINARAFNIVIFLIITLVLRKVQTLKGIRKTLGIDEALDFLEKPDMGSFIGYMFRTLRKKEGEIFIAAQNANFLEKLDDKIRDSILINSDTKIILSHNKHRSSIKSLQKTLSLSDGEIEALVSLKEGKNYREIFLKLGNTFKIVRLEVSEFAQAVYTSRQAEVVEMEKYYKEYGNMTIAIKKFIENKKLKDE